jgi:prepilin-type N-terminal cleavage/methylation domain-containing protein
MNARTHLRNRGFSLLEVLISVAILAFGLLALASLQAALIRSGSDAKARSVALSVAKDRVEELRSYRGIGDFTDLTDSTDVVQDSIAGGVDYQVTTTVTRYAYNSDPNNDGDTSDGAFVEVADDSAEQTGNFVDENEFKRISVAVEWTDANGVEQNVVVEDAIGSVDPANTGKIARRDPDSAQRRPQILITDPSLDAGVIPIAIGDGSETAATNPRPDVDTGIALQTSYDIYTFAALNDSSGNSTGEALAQSRVETFIVGCRCDTEEADSSTVDYRPTFWDGTRYVPPEEAEGYAVQAGQAVLRGGDPDQSILCESCCRDHHDPDNVAGPKFSPRFDEHEHFFDDLANAVGSGEYYEACRLIRVDGIFRVAADPYNEYVNTLRTATAESATAPFTDPTPDGTAADNYVDFVVSYLETQAGQSDPNDQLDQETADDLAETNLLNDATQEVQIRQERWMHARGLYIDWLEPEAKEALTEAVTECPEEQGLTESECLLRVLPFTSINVTELARWTPLFGTSAPVGVENGFFVDSTLSDFGENTPVRGRVTAQADGTASATATIRTSTVGLLASADFAINDYDQAAQTNNVADQPDDDGQPFLIVGPPCGLSPETRTINSRGGTQTYTSSRPCDGSDVTYPIANTLVRLRSTAGVGPTNVSIVLVAPDGTRYAVLTNAAWTSLPAVRDFASAGNPRQAGSWSVVVTNNDSGQADSIDYGFSVEFLYTAPFTVGLNGYTFVGTTQPGINVSAGGGCDALSAANNPTACSTTAPGVNTNLTLGTYNYSAIGTSQTVQCGASSLNLTCATTLHCTNFDIGSVTRNGTEEPGTRVVNSSGGITENTVIPFSSGILANDVIVIRMDVGTENAPSCTPKKQGNNFVCPNAAGFACQ